MLSRYIIVALLCVMLGMGWYINSLTDELESVRADLVVSKSNEIRLLGSITAQNEQIAKNEIDLQTKTNEYLALMAKPDRVRYEYVYSKVPTIGVKSNECNDIKKLIDDIRTTGY